jgi:hypothetical protein
VSKHLLQVEIAAIANDTGNNSCDNQSVNISSEYGMLPKWWKKIKAVQVLEEQQK